MVASLQMMAQRACIRNVRQITDIGDASWRIMHPILKKIESPAQLALIEENSPHIAEDTADVWKVFIRRDIPNGQRKLKDIEPTNPASWGKVYRRLKKENDKELSDAQEVLKAALNKNTAQKAANATQIVHQVIPEKGKRSRGSDSRGPAAGSQALKNARSIGDKMTILRRQTAIRQQGRSITQSIPSHQLQNKRSAISAAPISMVQQYTRSGHVPQQQVRPKAAMPYHTPRIFAPRTGPQSETERALSLAVRKEQEEKERRLRALTGGQPSTTARSAHATPHAPATQLGKGPSPAPRPSTSASNQRATPVTASAASPPAQRKRPASALFLPSKRKRT